MTDENRTDVPRLAADLLAAREERDEAVKAFMGLWEVSGDAIRAAKEPSLNPWIGEEPWKKHIRDMAEIGRSAAELHRRIADLGDSEDLTGCDGNEMLEAALTVCANFRENLKHDRALLSPTPPHTCQIHRATSGASDCGLSPCEEATVHRDRGASRPADADTPEDEKVCDTCHGEPATDCGCAPEYCSPENHACPDCGGDA